MQRVWPVLLLAGCPYVFGPADLSNVDRATDPSTADTSAPSASFEGSARSTVDRCCAIADAAETVSPERVP